MAQHHKRKEKWRFPRSLSIGEDAELEIAIYRTERVMDAVDPELQPVSTKVTRLGALPLVRKRGRIYEAAVRKTDALAVQVKSGPYKFKLKILVGGVNVANPLKSLGLQDYYVSHLQEWIDGVYIGGDRVRQFVALPSGTGHSIANQLKRLEDTGEIEIQVFAPQGIHLDDHNKLRYHKARPTPIEDTGHGFFVTIRTVDRAKHAVYNLRRSDPVWHLKACIQDILGNSGLNQELTFLGREIMDHKTLLEYGIQKASLLVLTTTEDDPEKKDVAVAEGEAIEMLKRIKKGKSKLRHVKEDLDAIKESSAGKRKTPRTELEERALTAQRIKHAMEELKQLKKDLGLAGPVTKEDKKEKQWRRPARYMEGESVFPLDSGSEERDSAPERDTGSPRRESSDAYGRRSNKKSKLHHHAGAGVAAPAALATAGRASRRPANSSRASDDEQLNVAPGGRIAQKVERDPNRSIWNLDRHTWSTEPIREWRIKIVDFDLVRDTSGLPSLPRLKERQRPRENFPSLDKSLDTSGLLSVANREAEQPSSVPFGVFAAKHTLPPIKPPSPKPTTRSRGGAERTGSRRGRDEARAARARRAAREREAQHESEDEECQCGCM